VNNGWRCVSRPEESRCDRTSFRFVFRPAAITQHPPKARACAPKIQVERSLGPPEALLICALISPQEGWLSADSNVTEGTQQPADQRRTPAAAAIALHRTAGFGASDMQTAVPGRER